VIGFFPFLGFGEKPGHYLDKLILKKAKKEKKGTDLFFCSCRLGLEIRRALSLGLGRDMPRRGRVVLPNFPHHVVQRGHNKQVVFAGEADFLYYLSTLEEYKEIYGVKVCGFCVMTNHVHLILQPGDAVAGMGRLMKRLAGRQTRFVNRQELRTGNAMGEPLSIESD